MLRRVRRALLGRSRGGVMNTIRRGQAAARVPNSADGGCARRGRPLWAVGMVAVTALATLLPAIASYSADDDAVRNVHEITWIHASPAQVHSFVLFVSPAPGSLAIARQIPVGKPGGANTESAQFFSALVPVALGEVVAVAAIGQNGLQSALSEWGQPQPSRPGQPLVVEP